MGQYYKPTTVTTHEYVYSHDFGCGLKLMEHSWVKNPFVKYVESLIAKGGPWEGKPIVWAGDYADPEVDEKGNVLKTKNEDGEEFELTLFDLAKTNIEPTKTMKLKYYRYVINETKKEFVDKNKMPQSDGWKVHPLPLLTCEGNGRGGGDYHGDGVDLIGTWARDVITVSTKKPKGYKEIFPKFLENW